MSYNLDLISRILCYGINVPDSISTKGAHADVGFVQGTVLMYDKRRPINTAVMGKMIDGRAVPLEEHDGLLYVRSGSRLIHCEFLEQPKCLDEELDGFGKIGDYIRYHSPTTIFASPLRECAYAAIGKPCLFCTYDAANPRPLPPEMFSVAFEKVRMNRSDVSLAIGPGSPNRNDYGARYFQNLLIATRKNWVGPVSIEMVPPKVDEIDMLIQEDVSSFIMSIEIWDDLARAYVCPGKSEISKAEYVNRWEHVVSKLGPGSVSSVLIVGLDSENNLIEAIDTLTKIGVIPTLIPFRPYDTVKKNLTADLVDHKLYMNLSAYNAMKLKQNRIGPSHQSGCTRCGGCSLEIDLALQ